MAKPLLIFVACLCLAGCTPVLPPQPSAPPPTAAATFTPAPSSTHTPEPSPTFTRTSSSTPTETAVPTATPLPTATPTPALPVGAEHTLPMPSLAILPDNLSRLTELARYGAARIYETEVSADRQRVFALTSEGVKVYRADTQERLAWFAEARPLTDEYNDQFWEFSSSADGSRFAFLGPGYQAQVYDIQAGLIYTQGLLVNRNTSVSISADGKYIAVPLDEGERYFTRWQAVDVQDGSVAGKGVGVYATFSPGGWYLAAESGYNIHIYRTADWQEQTQIGLSGGGGQIARGWYFSSDDRLLAVMLQDSLTVWEVESRTRLREFRPWSGERAEFWQAFFSNDGSLLAVLEWYEGDYQWIVWNIEDGNPAPMPVSPEQGPGFTPEMSEAFGLIAGLGAPDELDSSGYQAPADQFFTQAFDLTAAGLSVLDLTGWDAQTRLPEYKLCEFAFTPGASPPCRTASGMLGVTADTMGQYFSLWDAADGKVSLHPGLAQSAAALVTFPTEGLPVNLLGVSPDQKFLAYSLRYSFLQVRSLETGQVSLSEETGGWISRVQFTPDGRMLVVNVDDPEMSRPHILVYDVTQNAVTFRLPSRDSQGGRSAVLSAQGDRLAYRFIRWDAYRWNGIIIVDPVHLKRLAEFGGGDYALASPVAFSPDGSLLAAVDYLGNVFLLDSASVVVLHTWHAHADAVIRAAFSPDGRLLATLSLDGFIKIWGIWP